MEGGELTIEWRRSDSHILMTGPYTYDDCGEINIELI